MTARTSSACASGPPPRPRSSVGWRRPTSTRSTPGRRPRPSACARRPSDASSRAGRSSTSYLVRHAAMVDGEVDQIEGAVSALPDSPRPVLRSADDRVEPGRDRPARRRDPAAAGPREGRWRGAGPGSWRRSPPRVTTATFSPTAAGLRSCVPVMAPRRSGTNGSAEGRMAPNGHGAETARTAAERHERRPRDEPGDPPAALDRDAGDAGATAPTTTARNGRPAEAGSRPVTTPVDDIAVPTTGPDPAEAAKD